MSIAAGQKIKASHIPIITVYNLQCSGALTLVNGTFNDITGLSQTFTTLYANALAVVTVAFDFSVTTASGTVTSLCGGQLLVDAVAQAGQGDLDLNQIIRGTPATTWTGTLAAAGSHTIKAQARKTAAGGAAVCDTQSKMTITVIDQDVS